MTQPEITAMDYLTEMTQDFYREPKSSQHRGQDLDYYGSDRSWNDFHYDYSLLKSDNRSELSPCRERQENEMKLLEILDLLEPNGDENKENQENSIGWQLPIVANNEILSSPLKPVENIEPDVPTENKDDYPENIDRSNGASVPIKQLCTFPYILWQIINHCQTDSIRWSTNGNSIIIKVESFEQEYLSSGIHFKTKKMISFVRQLNLYGFRKINQSNNSLKRNKNMARLPYNPYQEYFHPNFKRDKPELLDKIKRRGILKVFRPQQQTVNKHNKTGTTKPILIYPKP